QPSLALVVPEPLAVAGREVAHLHQAGKLLEDVAEALIGLRRQRRKRAPIPRAGVVEKRAVIPEIAESSAELEGQAVAAREAHVQKVLLRDVVAVFVLVVEDAGLVVLEAAHVQVAEDIAARRSGGEQEQRIAVACDLSTVVHL